MLYGTVLVIKLFLSLVKYLSFIVAFLSLVPLFLEKNVLNIYKVMQTKDSIVRSYHEKI